MNHAGSALGCLHRLRLLLLCQGRQTNEKKVGNSPVGLPVQTAEEEACRQISEA